MEDKIWEKISRKLTEEQVIAILSDLGSAPPRRDGANNLIFQSVCHGSSSWKLCYYTDTHNFFCYRDWENFTIFSLIMKVKGCDFKEALNYVTNKFNYDTRAERTNGFINGYTKGDWDLFEKYSSPVLKETADGLTIIPHEILELYPSVYYEGWRKEGISIEAMQKYSIKYDPSNNRIIIPHYDTEGNLIGIRCRNLNKDASAKYCPVTIEGKLYSHPLSKYLYGFDKNKETIIKTQKVMICESEKSVLMAETFFPENNFCVACCGSNISYEQLELLFPVGVTEVILALDWDFKKLDDRDEEYKAYRTKMLRLSQKLLPYFSVKVLLPATEEFIYKGSPTDMGKDYLLTTMKKKVPVTYEMICCEKERGCVF